MPFAMKRSILSEHLSKLGRRGNKARNENLTPEERKELARRAGKRSGEVRAAAAQKKQRTGKKWSGGKQAE